MCMRKKRRHCSKGELDRLIDELVHPLSDRNHELMIVDAMLHGLVEQNPPETVVKYIHYSLPKIIRERANHDNQLKRACYSALCL